MKCNTEQSSTTDSDAMKIRTWLYNKVHHFIAGGCGYNKVHHFIAGGCGYNKVHHFIAGGCGYIIKCTTSLQEDVVI